MKKIFLFSVLFLLLCFSFVPKPALALGFTGPIVSQTCGLSTDASGNPLPTPTYSSDGTCSGGAACPCGIKDFFGMLAQIYSFIVWEIATPLAIISLTVGGILMMMSAGNPNLMTLGKKIFYSAVIGLALVFGSWVIINTIMKILGYSLNGNTDWNILQ